MLGYDSLVYHNTLSKEVENTLNTNVQLFEHCCYAAENITAAVKAAAKRQRKLEQKNDKCKEWSISSLQRIQLCCNRHRVQHSHKS
jgi:hypothetical protein